MVGVIYCRIPAVISVRRLIAAAKKINGVAVTTPEPSNKSVCDSETCPIAPSPLAWQYPRNASAGRNSNAVSRLNPSSESNLAVFLIKP